MSPGLGLKGVTFMVSPSFITVLDPSPSSSLSSSIRLVGLLVTNPVPSPSSSSSSSSDTPPSGIPVSPLPSPPEPSSGVPIIPTKKAPVPAPVGSCIEILGADVYPPP